MKRAFALAPVVALVAACSGAPASPGESEEEFNDGLSPALVAAAKANLKRVEREIDRNHMANYGMRGDLASQFVRAVRTEYAANLPLLRRRMETLASMIFFSAPEVETDPALGRLTPFHGMDEAAFDAMMHNEDFVFADHKRANGGKPNGVRPFSVCETKFLIEISKGTRTDATFIANRKLTSYPKYATAYGAYAASCPEKDLLEWYNFRGLGGLRPSWLESNLSDRFLRRQVKACRAGTSSADCNAWNADRIGYRDRKNTELALRTMIFDPRTATTIGSKTAEDYMRDPKNSGVFIEDRNGDGIGEWLAPGPLALKPGARVAFGAGTSFKLPAETSLTLSQAVGSAPSGTKVKVRAGTRVETDAKIVYDAIAGGPIVVARNAKLRLQAGTSLALEGGTTVSVPSSDRAITGKLDAELPIAVAAGAKLAIGRPGGMFADNQFVGELQAAIPLAAGGTIPASVNPADAVAHELVDPAWKKQYLGRKDLGLLTIFPNAPGCNANAPNEANCPLLRRFYSMIDRHEDFYQTYSSMSGTTSIISQQPSPLVACSVTLRASHHWDDAGTPPGGTAGFIYLMRIPFAEILSSDARSIDTLGRLKDANGDGAPDDDLKAGPKVATIERLYSGDLPLEMDKVWLDIATLSNNAYAQEHEISKFGSVPAEQIEGILVVRLPAAMSGAVDPGEGVEHEPIDEEDVYYDHHQ
jgi:hypothetical protein